MNQNLPLDRKPVKCFSVLLLDWEGKQRVSAFPKTEALNEEFELSASVIPEDIDWVDKHIGTEATAVLAQDKGNDAPSDLEPPSSFLFIKRPIKKTLRFIFILLEKGIARAKKIIG